MAGTTLRRKNALKPMDAGNEVEGQESMQRFADLCSLTTGVSDWSRSACFALATHVVCYVRNRTP